MPWGALAAGAGSAIVGGLMGGGKSPKPKPMVSSITGTGMFDLVRDPSKGRTARTLRLDPRMKQYQNLMYERALGNDPFQQQLSDLGQGFLNQVGSFDPWQAAETQFSRLEAILNPARERERQAQEARLFAQGRLGSTGGGIEQEATQTAVEQQRAKSLIDALAQAQDLQGTMLQRGTSLGMMPYQMQSGAFGDLTNMQQLAQGVANAGIQGGSYTPSPSWQQQIGSGLMQGGMNLFGQGLKGMDWGGLWGGNTPVQSSNYSNYNVGGMNYADTPFAFSGR